MTILLDNGVLVERREGHILTTLPDGTQSANWPWPDDSSYVAVAGDCGFGPDRLLDYCHEHELLHSLLPLRFFGRPGYTVRMAATGRKADIAGASAEERLIYYVQRYIAGALPCVDPQWQDLAREVQALLPRPS